MFLFKHFKKNNKKRGEGGGDSVDHVLQIPSSISLKNSKEKHSKKSQSDIPKKSGQLVSSLPLPINDEKKPNKSLSDRSHLPKNVGHRLLDEGNIFFSTPDIWSNAPTSPIMIPKNNAAPRTLRKSISIESSPRGDSFDYERYHRRMPQSTTNTPSTSPHPLETPIIMERPPSCSLDVICEDPLVSLSPFDRMMALCADPGMNHSFSEESTDIHFNNVRPLVEKSQNVNILIAEMADPIHPGRSMTVVLKKQPLHFETAATNYRSIHESNFQRMLSDPILSNKRGYPHIVSFIDHVISTAEKFHFIIMEYCIHGDLLTFVTKNAVRASAPITRLLLKDVGMGLKYMHGLNIAHRDLKLENVFLSWDRDCGRVIAKIGDFGHACQIFEKTKDSYTLGSPDYAAPELLRGGRHNSLHGDRWSYGVCLFSAFEKRFPFQINRTTDGFIINPFIVNGVEIETYSLQFNWMAAEPEFADLLSKIFIYKSKDRLGMKAILKHSFFKKAVFPLVF